MTVVEIIMRLYALIKCGAFTRYHIHCGDVYRVLYHTTSYLKTPYDTRALLLFCGLYTVVESIYIMTNGLWHHISLRRRLMYRYCNITDNCLALAAFYDLDFPQYQIPPMPDSTIFIFGEEKIIYTTRHTFRSCIYTSPSPYREFRNAVFMGFLSILCKSFTLFLTIFYKAVHKFIFM